MSNLNRLEFTGFYDKYNSPLFLNDIVVGFLDTQYTPACIVKRIGYYWICYIDRSFTNREHTLDPNNCYRFEKIHV